MRISDISFGTTDWSTIEAVEHKGEQGSSFWKTIQFGDISAVACGGLLKGLGVPGALRA